MLVLAEFPHLPVPDWSESGLMRSIRNRLDTTAPAAFATSPPRHFNNANRCFRNRCGGLAVTFRPRIAGMTKICRLSQPTVVHAHCDCAGIMV
jgi:hypothetical protein